MCGRYSLTASPEDVRALFGYEDQPNFPPRYNIAPTQAIAIVRQVGGARRFALVRWGLMPSWVKDPASFSLLINARAETAHEKPAFRGSMRHHRCLIPANGFYEWRRGPGNAKQPYWIAPKDGGLVAFAGLWADWMSADGSEMESAAILTTQANGRIAPIHNRMPAVIAPEQFDLWLDTANVDAREASALLAPAPDDLFEAIPVSSRVNAVRNDDPELQREATVEEPPAEKPKRATKAAGRTSSQLDLF